MAAVVGLVAGCGGTTADRGPQSRPAPSPPSSSGSPGSPSSPFSPAPSSPEVAATPACVQVRAGIDAFNLGKYDETVSHFERAVPLARRAVSGDLASRELLEAVRYYARLDAADYPAAARGSAAFAKYKAITLDQCYVATPSPAEPTPSGRDA